MHCDCDLLPFVDTATLVVHEFAFLCLSSLAVDFTAKITIAERGGVPLLVTGLASRDPDIQRNCVETLALVLQVAHLVSDHFLFYGICLRENAKVSKFLNEFFLF